MRIPLTLLITYVICGVITAYSSFLLTARVSAGEPLLGAEFPLQSITAAILGGCSLRGGQGGVGGAIVGAIFVTVLANGMDLMRLGSNHQMIILGFVLVIAVLLDRERTKLGYVSTAADVRKVMTSRCPNLGSVERRSGSLTARSNCLAEVIAK